MSTRELVTVDSYVSLKAWRFKVNLAMSVNFSRYFEGTSLPSDHGYHP